MSTQKIFPNSFFDINTLNYYNKIIKFVNNQTTQKPLNPIYSSGDKKPHQTNPKTKQSTTIDRSPSLEPFYWSYRTIDWLRPHEYRESLFPTCPECRTWAALISRTHYTPWMEIGSGASQRSHKMVEAHLASWAWWHVPSGAREHVEFDPGTYVCLFVSCVWIRVFVLML